MYPQLLEKPETETTVESHPSQNEGWGTRHLNDKRVEILESDALRFSFIEKYDLAVADPYYEDVHSFLDIQLDNLNRFVDVLLLVPGNIEDRSWNASVLSRVERAGREVRTHELYGQVIFEIRSGR